MVLGLESQGCGLVEVLEEIIVKGGNEKWLQIYRKRPERCRFLEVGGTQRCQRVGSLLCEGVSQTGVYVFHLRCWVSAFLFATCSFLRWTHLGSRLLYAEDSWLFASSLVSFLYSMLLELFSYISTWISNKHLAIVSITQSCPTLCDPMDRSVSDLLSLTISRSLPKFMFSASRMPSSHLILWRPLLLLPLIVPSIRDFSNELPVHIRWSKYWGFSFTHSSECSNKHVNIYKNRSFCSIFIENLFNPVSHKPSTISYHISLPPFEAISTYNSPATLLAQLFKYPSFKKSKHGFPGGTSGKEPACQCRKCKRCRFDPWLRKIPWKGAWQPTPIFLPGESLWTEELGKLLSIEQSWTRLKQVGTQSKYITYYLD